MNISQSKNGITKKTHFNNDQKFLQNIKAYRAFQKIMRIFNKIDIVGQLSLGLYEIISLILLVIILVPQLQHTPNGLLYVSVTHKATRLSSVTKKCLKNVYSQIWTHEIEHSSNIEIYKSIDLKKHCQKQRDTQNIFK